ncbi:MAG: hypothetical protein JST93_11195 [Acidobacteria bacterium]|nr:hypothetical protein [Acidobacteriota bacterium]
MFPSSKCTLFLFLAAAAWGQSGGQWPTQSIAAPGTAGLPMVNMTSLPTGFTTEVVASLTEQCMPAQQTGAASTQRPQLECTTLSGNPTLMIRQGTRLTRAGETLLPTERAVTQQGIALGTNIEGLELIDEGFGQTTPFLRTLARVETPELSCTVSPAGQSVLTHRGIQSFVFNDPLNVLYVETIHSKTTFAPATTTTPGATGFCGASTTVAEFPIFHESTRTLIRVRGFNNVRPN